MGYKEFLWDYGQYKRSDYHERVRDKDKMVITEGEV